jgi:GNAT superfamily N-acetyltransferase
MRFDMTKTITINKACIEDLPAIMSLYQQEEMDNGFALPLKEAENIFKKVQSYPNYQFYIAKYDDSETSEIIGVFGLLIMDNLGHQGTPSAIIEGVCVNENLHGQGIGKKMMQAAKMICEAAGCYKMALSSNIKREKAHGFYDSLGFTQHGISFQLEL